MRSLPDNFLVFQYCGLWRPIHWSPGWRTKLYDSYTVLMLIVIFTTITSQLMGFIVSENVVDNISKDSFLLLAFIAMGSKSIYILIKRSKIIEMTERLREVWNLPRCPEEMDIQNEYDRMARLNFFFFGTTVEISLVIVVMSSLISDVPLRKLTFHSWLPFNVDRSAIRYCVAWCHQMVGGVVGSNVNVAFDMLVQWFMLQTCSQINILKYRIDAIPRKFDDKLNCSALSSGKGTTFSEIDLLGDCVKQHREIFRFAEATNKMFGFIVFLQYTISAMAICVSMFNLSKIKIFSQEFPPMFLYLTCLSMEIFLYCFYGSVVSFESVSVGDGIYQMDWTALSTETKRNLIVFINRSQRPIIYTSFALLTLDLDSFTSLIKLSYSAYNVLQHSSA